MAKLTGNKVGSLAGRAAWALVLMVGFYVLALGIAGGLLYLPYAELVYANRLHLKLAFGCVVGAGVILWAVMPRRDRFEPPGPSLTAADQPRLFEVISQVARDAGQAMPAEIYAVDDVNAFVAQRGGVMGLGSRRVMGLGLPLMQATTVDQLRSVLAHEFGHYHGGDVKLGPWIYKTRAAIERTLQTLASADAQLLHKPFLWYGKIFMRVTQAISRQQEYAADALAARIVGPGPMIEGLKRTYAAGAVHSMYGARMWFRR